MEEHHSLQQSSLILRRSGASDHQPPSTVPLLGTHVLSLSGRAPPPVGAGAYVARKQRPHPGTLMYSNLVEVGIRTPCRVLYRAFQIQIFHSGGLGWGKCPASPKETIFHRRTQNCSRSKLARTPTCTADTVHVQIFSPANPVASRLVVFFLVRRREFLHASTYQKASPRTPCCTLVAGRYIGRSPCRNRQACTTPAVEHFTEGLSYAPMRPPSLGSLAVQVEESLRVQVALLRAPWPGAVARPRLCSHRRPAVGLKKV